MNKTSLLSLSASPQGTSIKIAASILLALLFFVLLYIAGMNLAVSGLIGAIVLGTCLILSSPSYVRSMSASVATDKVPVGSRYVWEEEVDETPVSPQDEAPDQPEEPEGEEEVNDGIDFRHVMEEDLLSIGVQPQWDDDTITFRYQGGFFRVVNLENDVVRIIYPRIFSVDATKQDLLFRVLNRLNSNYALLKVIGTDVPGTDGIEVFAYADMYYTSAVESRVALLEVLIGLFFEVQRALVTTVSVDSMVDEAWSIEAPAERAYRDFSLN